MTYAKPKTNPALIKLIKKLNGRPFDQLDWEAFAGCESEDPHITDINEMVVIADGDKLSFIHSEEYEEVMLNLLCVC